MTELKPFQDEDCYRIYSPFRGRCLLAWEMGLGKTLAALYWILKIKRRPVAIICPASVKYSWQAEAYLHFGLHAEVLEGRCKSVQPLPADIVILNYEILKSWLPSLKKAKLVCIIFDEIQYCKDIQAQRTRAAFKLVKKVPSVIGLSGTPLTNRPIELWAPLHLIRPDIFPDRIKYAWRYCKPIYTKWGWQYTGAENLGELREILVEEVMIRRRKKDVEKELPPKIRRVVSFRLPQGSHREYRQAQNDFMNWLRQRSPGRAERAKKSQALVKVGYLLRLVAKLKLPSTKLWIKEFFEMHPKKKLVAMTMNTFVIDELKESFPNSVVIDGRVTGRKREEAKRKFQVNSRVSLLLGNWRAAGVGLNLQAAHNFAGLDFPWTPGDLLQGEDRIHRIGQKEDCIIHYMATLGTIEEKLMRILYNKFGILDQILDGGKSGEELDIFDTLLEEIEHE